MLVSCETCRRSYHGYCLDPMPLSDGEWVCPYAGSDPKHKTRSKRTQNKLEQAEYLASERRNSRKTKYGLPLVVDFASGWLTKEIFLRPPAPPPAPVESARGGKRTSTPGTAPTGRGRGKRAASVTTPTAEPRAKGTAATAAGSRGGVTPQSAKASGHANEHFATPSTPTASAARSAANTAEKASHARTPQQATTQAAFLSSPPYVSPLRLQPTPQPGQHAPPPTALTILPDFSTEVMLDKEVPNLFVPSTELIPLGFHHIASSADLEMEQINALEIFCQAKDRENVWLESRKRVSNAATDLLSGSPVVLHTPKPSTAVEEDLVTRSATLTAAGLVQSLPRAQFDQVLIPGLKRMLGDGSQLDLLRFLAYQRLEQVYRLGNLVKTYDQLKTKVGVAGVASEEMPGTNGLRPNVEAPPPTPHGRPIIFPSYDGSTPVTNFGGVPLDQKIQAQQRYTESTQSPRIIDMAAITAAQKGNQPHTMKSLFGTATSTPHGGIIRAPAAPSTPVLFSTTTGQARTPQTPSNFVTAAASGFANSPSQSQSRAQNGTAHNLATISGTLSDFVPTSPLSQNSGLRVHYASPPSSSTALTTTSNPRKRPNENPEDHAPGTKSAKSAGQATPHTPQTLTSAAKPVSIAVSNADWEALVDQGISAIQPRSASSSAPGTSPTAVNQAALASRLQDMASSSPQTPLSSGGRRTLARNAKSGGTSSPIVLDLEENTSQPLSLESAAPSAQESTPALKAQSSDSSNKFIWHSSGLSTGSSSMEVDQPTPQQPASTPPTLQKSTSKTSTEKPAATTPTTTSDVGRSPSSTAISTATIAKHAEERTPANSQSATTQSNGPEHTPTPTISRNSSSNGRDSAPEHTPKENAGNGKAKEKKEKAKEKEKEREKEREKEASQPLNDASQKDKEPALKEKQPSSSMETPKRNSSSVSSSSPSASTSMEIQVPSTPSNTTSSVETPAATPVQPSDKVKKELRESSNTVTLKPAVPYTAELRAAAHQITTSYWTTERLALAQALRTISPEIFSAIRHRQEDLGDPSKSKIYGVLLGVVNEDNTVIGIPLFATNSIGRDMKDVILGELGGTKISRAHASLTWKPETKTWLLDVQGKHGVRVNDVPNPAKTTAEVKDGDMLMFSSTRLVIRTLQQPITK